MDVVNTLLNDQSENDKKLIKELSIYVKNFNKTEKRINKEFVLNIANIVLQNYEVDYNYLQLINENLSGAWDEDNGIININLTNILKNAKEHGKHQKEYNNVISRYFPMETIIHEITHARQSYINSNSFNLILYSCLDLLNTDYNEYMKNWQYVMVERYARLRACTISYAALSYIYENEELEYIKSYMFYQFMLGYNIKRNNILIPAGYETVINKDDKIISPLETYNKVMEMISLPTVNIYVGDNLDLYSRLYLGIDITLDEYRKIDGIYEDIYLNNIPVGDVRKLINK